MNDKKICLPSREYIHSILMARSTEIKKKIGIPEREISMLNGTVTHILGPSDEELKILADNLNILCQCELNTLMKEGCACGGK